jgi:hypothetical protein
LIFIEGNLHLTKDCCRCKRRKRDDEWEKEVGEEWNKILNEWEQNLNEDWAEKDKQWQAEFDAEVARKMEEAGFGDES